MMSESNSSRVSRILKKLMQVRERGLTCFGSEKHQFRLNPPISEADLGAFETRHSIQLPDDYRTFLREAGNGGAGPYYGILPLEQWDYFVGEVVDSLPESFLALPCPLYPDMEGKADSWAERFKNCVSPYQGTLSLGDQGCTFATQLIVSGPFAGRVIYVDAAAAPPYIVWEVDFLAWYERWLDELLQGYEINWFGYGPGGGEEDYWRILNDLQASDVLKAEAASSLCRLPRVSAETVRRIPALLGSRIAGVREGGLAAISRFKIRSAVDQAAGLLDDPSPEVRKRAVYVVMELDRENGIERVLRRLHGDPDKGVANAAFFKLKEAGALSKPELVRIIKESPLESLRYSAVVEVLWTDEDMPLLFRMASDKSVNVRLCAKSNLRKLMASRNLLPEILDFLEREKAAGTIDGVLNMLTEYADPSTVPVLLKWAAKEDDIHSLRAIEALAKIGDERALPIIKSRLQDDRHPQRTNPYGSAGMSSTYTCSELIRIRLKESRNPAFRKL
jgi:HEAT repeat protein